MGDVISRIPEELRMDNGGMTNERKQLVLIGMPCWDVGKPFHSLAIVASVAREADLAVRLYDLNIAFYHHVSEKEREYWLEDNTSLWIGDDLPRDLWEKYDEWLCSRLDEVLDECDPSLLGFTVNFCTRYFSIRAAKYLKSRRPDIPIMFGGVDCFPGEQNEVFLSTGDDRYCDIICQGECEIAFTEYLLSFKESGDWKTRVPGFAYYEGGNLVNTGDVELPMLKDKQPLPAFDLFDLSLYTERGSLPFYFTRGCVNRCHFCSERTNFRRFRCRNAEEAVEEIKAILPFAQKYCEVPTLSLADSMVNASPGELEKFADLIIENGIKITWGGQAHINRHMTYEMLEKLKRAGFSSVFWGIETGSQNVVDLMNKRYSWEEAHRILNDCCQLEIRQHIPILIGYPGETPKDLVDTLEIIFLYQDKEYCFIHQPNLIVVRPKSPLYEQYADYGLANNSYYEWATADNTNTLPIRISRRFVARQAQGNRDLSMDGLVDTEEILNVNLDEPNVARDVFDVLYHMLSRAEKPDLLYRAIDDWDDRRFPAKGWFRSITDIGRWRKKNGTESSADAAAEDDPTRTRYFGRWNQLDKNSPKGREKLYKLILVALGRVKDKIKQNPSPARTDVL